ncbi:P-loop containing nucleoside triphosphate hydrolase protein [Aspergillus ellipticus CBS 707.79]|uniref:P-loop containing nucleoside triphosphate hydrolase protein n=1 Tax=Aspergillus ellipticus CBS 707.79 TaxID=1448320 RepID=A0A319CQG3_9EURO|nr:P-loop containing nucleoside triphosphate hydrolase protein [Aspergillus ellipticus CBS 707.79]
MPSGRTMSVSLDTSAVAVLSLSGLFILAALGRYFHLRRSPIKVVPNYRGLWKELLAVLLAGLHLAVLISLTTHARPLSLAPAIATFAASLLIPALSFVEHGRSICPSTILNLYLFASLVLDVVRIAWLRIVTNDGTLSPWALAITAVTSLLLVLEAQNKRSILREQWQNASAEETAGIFSRIFLAWILPLLRKGNGQLLILDDLFDMHSELSSQVLRGRMLRYWGKRSQPEGKHSLLFAAMRCTFWQNARALPLLLLVVTFQYAQPSFISRVITFVITPLSDEEQRSEALKLVISVVVIFVGLSIGNGLSELAISKASLAMKGALVGIIHEKALTIGGTSQGSAVTLLGNDVQDIKGAVYSFHQVLLSAFQLIVGMYLLAVKLQWVCLIPVAIVLGTTKVSSYVASSLGSKQQDWSLATEKRISLTTASLENMKTVKMMGMSEHMATKITAAREDEIKENAAFNAVISLLTAVSGFVKNFAPVLTLAIYAIQARLRGQGGLDTNTAFTAIAIITLVTQPMIVMMTQAPSLVSAIAGFGRIQEYLLSSSFEDNRLIAVNEGPWSAKLTGTPDDCSSQDGPLAIEVQGATIRPAPDAEPVLKNIDLSIQEGSLVFCVGAVGTGKTTLAKAILGELSPDFGVVKTSSHTIGYCAQSAWLTNGTVQQLICGPAGINSVDEQWYKKVVYACDLIDDIQRMPKGDQTVIGSGGVILSGGQRQRVALARAVYSRLGILVLDDVLSALDAQTETRIVDRLLGTNGLLRNIGTTVFLITHTTQHFPLADYIVVLNEGQVSEQGTWDQLRAQSGYISNVILHEADRRVQEEGMEDGAEVKSSASTEPERSMDRVRQKGDTALYSYYFSSMGGFNVALMATGMALMSLFSVVSQYWLKWWTEAGENGRQWVYITGYVLLAAATWITNLSWVAFLLVKLAPKSSIKFHQTVLRTVINAPLSFFTATDTGTTLTRFSQDLKQIDRALPGSVAGTGLNLFRLLGQLLLLLMAQRYMGITFPFLMLIMYSVQMFYLHTTRQLRWIEMESASLVSNSFLDTVQGLTTIRAFGWGNAFAADNSRCLDTSQKPEYNLMYLQTWLHFSTDLVVAGLALSLVLFAIFFRGSVSGGEMGIAVNVLLSVSISLMVVLEGWTRFESSLGVISRIKSFEKEVDPESKPGEDHEPPAAWPEEGTVQFQETVAGYSSESNALDHISLQISPGEKIGICGRTGSGKSSLLLSLLRLIELSSGTIAIDDLDLQTLPRETIRSRIITIPQDPLLMKSVTVRENLDATGTIPDKEIIATLEKVKLWSVFTSRDTNPQTTDTSSPESTTIQVETCLDAALKDYPLSTGEQQLFSLARAMLMRSTRGKLVILDEATSNIDKETDALIQDLLRVEFQGYTVLTVAHRLNTILDSDKVVVLDQGRVVEVGAPRELVEKKQGAFKNLLGK